MAQLPRRSTYGEAKGGSSMATADHVFNTFRRALTLDGSAYEEIRDDPSYTPYSIAAAGIAILLAAIGAWLWADTVADATPGGWFLDTVVLGTIFTAALMAAGLGVMYVVLTQVLREAIPTPDGFVRVAALGHVSYAVALLVFLPQVGFGFGLIAIAFVFFDTVFAIRSAYPSVSAWNATVAVSLGMAVWLALLPMFSDAPDNNFVTGPFVYSLFE
jgi:hypothetical protein